tara:strand:- start:28 stop:138 length:111 start_codon:yes stop_codon:yes gene_type:complete
MTSFRVYWVDYQHDQKIAAASVMWVLRGIGANNNIE